MKDFWLKYKKLHPDAKKPYLATKDSVAYDLYAIEDVMITAARPYSEYTPLEALYPGIVKVRTGLAMQFPIGWGAYIEDKSGVGSKGIHHLAGVIDFGYRGEWLVVLINLSSRDYKINKGDRFCQVGFHEVGIAEPEEVEELDDSERGTGGFGSTGVK